MTLTTVVEQNVTSILDVFNYANTVTNFIFWQLMLLVIFIVTFVSLRSKNSTEQSFSAAGFLTGVIGIFMYSVGIVQELPLIVSIILIIGSFVALLTTKE